MDLTRKLGLKTGRGNHHYNAFSQEPYGLSAAENPQNASGGELERGIEPGYPSAGKTRRTDPGSTHSLLNSATSLYQKGGRVNTETCVLKFLTGRGPT